MTIVWMLLGIGIVGVLVKRVAWPNDRDGLSHLGFVSHQWLAEHRVTHVSDPRR